ncbi:hypothetical protein V5F38_14260 [Xanthobacter sp. V0B-10]|uniref:hypothetical protein n=1 Tax=Xanthobacter albus TaxID=3119929 RepID=UPI00372BFBEF
MKTIYCADSEDARDQREFLTSCGDVEGKDFVLKPLDELHDDEVRSLLEAGLEEGRDFRMVTEEELAGSGEAPSDEGLRAIERVGTFLSMMTGQPVRFVDARTGELIGPLSNAAAFGASEF